MLDSLIKENTQSKHIEVGRCRKASNGILRSARFVVSSFYFTGALDFLLLWLLLWLWLLLGGSLIIFKFYKEKWHFYCQQNATKSSTMQSSGSWQLCLPHLSLIAKKLSVCVSTKRYFMEQENRVQLFTELILFCIKHLLLLSARVKFTVARKRKNSNVLLENT